MADEAVTKHSGAPGETIRRVWVHLHGGAFSGGEQKWGVDFVNSLMQHLTEPTLCVVPKILTDNAAETHAVIKETIQRYAIPDVPLVLSGSSSGGWHALEVHRNDIPEISALVLLCPVVKPEMRMMYLDAVIDGAGSALDLLPKSVEPIAVPAATKIRTLQRNFDGALDASDTPPTVPTMMICGRRDKNVPLMSLCGTMGAVDETHILDGGHELQKRVTAETAPLIRRFVDKL